MHETMTRLTVSGSEGDSMNYFDSGMRARLRSSLLGAGMTVLAALATNWCGLTARAWADSEAAWEALSDLRIEEAKRMYQAEIDAGRKTPEVLRGLTLAAFFDLDHETEVSAIRQLAETGGDDPFLLAIYEHVALEMTEWEESSALESTISAGLSRGRHPAIAYVGDAIVMEQRNRVESGPNKTSLERFGLAPGCWVSGPYDNSSNIAAYRRLPLETAPMDTLGAGVGLNGVRAGWTWVTSAPTGDIIPHRAYEDLPNHACILRAYFELPSEMAVTISMGGIYAQRTYIDGVLVGDDPVQRNAVIRSGYKSTLSAGIHEIGIVLSFEAPGNLRLGVLDAGYRPIAGLKWLRHGARGSSSKVVDPRIVHPIFDAFEDSSLTDLDASDVEYWRLLLRHCNGYSKEVVDSLAPQYGRGELSPLQTWLYCQALKQMKQDVLRAEVLASLNAQTDAALVRFVFIYESEQNWETKIGAFESMSLQFPARFEIENVIAFRPLINQDVAGSIRLFKDLAKRFPNAAAAHEVMADLFARLNDYTSALEEIRKVGEGSRRSYAKRGFEINYLAGLGRYAESVRLLEDPMKGFARLVELFPTYLALLERIGDEKKITAILDRALATYPNDIELLSMKWYTHNRRAEHEAASRVLAEIHRVKPDAVRPYLALNELHNGHSYDTLFGALDPMTLWQSDPPEAEMGPSRDWKILDRRQKVVFESGVVLTDVHDVTFMGDEETASAYREMQLPVPITPDQDRLLSARRLRRGAAPLEGTVNEESVVFRDLKPGDAVEFHYRYWDSRSGDLWNHFWDTYTLGAPYYQRYYEYTIFTNRTDMRVAELGPVPKVDSASHCGFRRFTWSGTNAPAIRTDLPFLPPLDEVLGTIQISTIKSWRDVDSWYGGISDAILRDNPHTAERGKQFLHELGKPAAIGAMYDFATINVPYQAVTFDYSATVPRPPDVVISGNWGDCKDKSHVLLHMLRQAGVSCWPVLVSTADNSSRLLVPSAKFDHLIVCAIIDRDTLFLDPSSELSPLRQSLGISVAGHPCLVVGWEQGDTLLRIPPYRPDDWRREQVVELWPMENDRFAFKSVMTGYGQNASYRRASWRSTPESEVRTAMEASLDNRWGVDVTIDSARIDEVNCTDSIFSTVSFGSLLLNRQVVGTTEITRLPNWSLADRSLTTDLSPEFRGGLPADLISLVCDYTLHVTLRLPASSGTPHVPEPVRMNSDYWDFEYKRSWNPGRRVLDIDAKLVVRPGRVPVDELASLLTAQTAQFELPLVMQR